MPDFRYTAVDPLGRSLHGVLQADTLADAQQQITTMGLKLVSCQPLVTATAPLDAETALFVTQQLQSSTETGLPLTLGLRGIAEEVRSSKVRTALLNACEKLEAGAAPAEVLAQLPDTGLSHLSSLLASRLPPAALGQAIERSLDFRQKLRGIKLRTLALLSYPLIVLTSLVSLWVFLLVYLVPQTAEMLTDFGTEVPLMTQYTITLSEAIIYWRVSLGFMLLVLVLGIWIGLQSLNKIQRRRLICAFPVVGSILRYSSLSELAFHLGLYLEHQVPLPDAVEWSGSTCGDADLAEVCRDLALAGRQGQSMSSHSEYSPQVPMALQQLIYWAETHPGRAELLRSAAADFQQRARQQIGLMLPILEPIFIFFAALGTGWIAVSLLMPSIKLLNDLS